MSLRLAVLLGCVLGLGPGKVHGQVHGGVHGETRGGHGRERAARRGLDEARALEPDVAALARAARGAHYGRARSAVLGLRRAGRPGVDGLAGALASRHAAIRILALRALVALGPAAVDALPDVAGLIERHEAVPDLPLDYAGAHLFARLEEGVADLGEHAGVVLGERGPERRKAPRVEDERSALRAEALLALARLGAHDPDRLLSAIAAVREPGGLTVDAYSDVRLTFGLALRVRTDAVERALAALVHADPAVQAAGLGALSWLASDGARFTDAVRALLDSPEPGVRLRALALVPSLPFTCEALELLLRARLADRALDARLLAARSFAALCGTDPALAPVVAEGLEARRSRTLLFALAAAARVERLSAEHLGAVIALVDHERAEVRAAAAGCLGEHGPAARRALIPLKRRLRDADPRVRRAVESALARIVE